LTKQGGVTEKFEKGKGFVQDIHHLPDEIQPVKRMVWKKMGIKGDRGDIRLRVPSRMALLLKGWGARIKTGCQRGGGQGGGLARRIGPRKGNSNAGGQSGGQRGEKC